MELKKFNRFSRIIFFIILFFAFLVVVHSIIGVVSASGLGEGFNSGLVTNDQNIDSNLKTPIEKVWNTLIYIVQIISIASIVIVGVRYMFASADEKADLKKSLIPLVIGAVIVFSASTIASFIVSASKSAGIQ